MQMVLSKTTIGIGGLGLMLALIGFLLFSALGSGQVSAKGNGLPDGATRIFSFNLIGTPGVYTGGCGNGHRIFVERDGNHGHIDLFDDDDGWHIVDCNGTGGNTGILHTDNVGDKDESGKYNVYVRILGKPGGKLKICVKDKTVHGADTDDPHDISLCELGTIDLTRGKGNSGGSKFAFKPSSVFASDMDGITWSTDTNKNFRIARFVVVQIP